jgi:hypothetical protein
MAMKLTWIVVGQIANRVQSDRAVHLTGIVSMECANLEKMAAFV